MMDAGELPEKNRRCRKSYDSGSVGIVTERGGWGNDSSAPTNRGLVFHRHRDRHWLNPLPMQADVVIAGRERGCGKAHRHAVALR